MDNKYIENLRIKVKEALKADNMRYQHTLGVAGTSACLAMCHGADMNRAYIAGLLHDFGKNGERFAGVLKGIRRNIDHALSGAAFLYRLGLNRKKTLRRK